jgi:hypothetical protein
MTNNFMARHLLERSIVDESLRQNSRAGPSSRRPRPVPVRHIDMKAAVPDDLEQRDAAVVRQWPTRRQSSDGHFQGVNIGRP